MCGLYTNLGVTILSFVVRKDQHLGRECMVNKANKEKDVKIRLAFERWQRRVSRQGKEYSQFRQQKKSQKKKDNTLIRFPSEFSIYSPDKPLFFVRSLRSIYEVRNKIYNPDERLYLDFTNTKTMKMAALVILYANVETSIRKGLSYRILFSTDFKVNQLLRDSGLVALCRGEKIKPVFENVENLPIISGVGGEYRDEIIDFIQKEIYKNKMKPETEHTYADAVQEAINNVGLHAYPHKNNDEKQWWLACHVIHDQLYLAIYDEGVGIPETVMQKTWFMSTLKSEYPGLKVAVKEELERIGLGYTERSKVKVGIVSDAVKIAISMIGDVTGTANDKHGQGSKSIKALVLNNEHGNLWIYSNLGMFKLSNQKGDKINELTHKVPGTLIQWNIKVSYED